MVRRLLSRHELEQSIWTFSPRPPRLGRKDSTSGSADELRQSDRSALLPLEAFDVRSRDFDMQVFTGCSTSSLSRQVCDQDYRVDFLHFVRTSMDRRQAIGTWQKRERRPPLPALLSRQLHVTTTWRSIIVPLLTRENCEVPFEHMPRNDVRLARPCRKSSRPLRHLR